MWWQMIVVTWGVSLAEISSCIVMPNIEGFYKQNIIHVNLDSTHIASIGVDFN